MTIKEARDILYTRVLLEVMNVTERPYFKPLDVAGAKRMLKNMYNMSGDVHLDLKKGKLTLELEIDHDHDNRNGKKKIVTRRISRVRPNS